MWGIHTSGVRTGWGPPPPYSIDFTPLRYAFLNIDLSKDRPSVLLEAFDNLRLDRSRLF